MREELLASMGPIELADLRPHLARDAVITVDRSLDLVEVGEALAKDDKARVGTWIEAGLIGKPTLEAIGRWSQQSPSCLVSLIVQPFVLVQENTAALS